MNNLINTNVVIDLLLKRTPFYKDAQNIMLILEKKIATGYISASAVTYIYYIVYKSLKCKQATYTLLNQLFSIICIATVDNEIIHKALNAHWDDFEDCVQFTACKNSNIDYIVTRNLNDFMNASITAITPGGFVQKMLHKE